VAAVELLMDIQLRKRRAVDGEVVGEAEGERGEVLVGVTGRGRPGLGPSGMALFAASASVLERPGAVGALGNWPFPFSAVVSHHRHPPGTLPP
jgi:hypothetical protein